MIGAMWSIYQAYHSTHQNRRSRENEDRLLESMRDYEEVAAYMRNPQASTLLGMAGLPMNRMP